MRMLSIAREVLQNDNMRGNYGLKEATLATTLAEASSSGLRMHASSFVMQQASR